MFFLANLSNKEITSMDSPIYNDEYAFSFADSLVDNSVQIDLQVEKKHFLEEVQKAMNRLPLKEREVISNIYLAEQTPKEVAGELNVSLAHIYRLQKQGVQRMRGMLARFKKNW